MARPRPVEPPAMATVGGILFVFLAEVMCSRNDKILRCPQGVREGIYLTKERNMQTYRNDLIRFS